MTTEPARGQIDIFLFHAYYDFGVGGQLGVESKRELTERGYQVHIFARTQIDITSQAAVEQCISNEDPGLVFNSAAYNRVDLAQKEPAFS